MILKFRPYRINERRSCSINGTLQFVAKVQGIALRQNSIKEFLSKSCSGTLSSKKLINIDFHLSTEIYASILPLDDCRHPEFLPKAFAE